MTTVDVHREKKLGRTTVGLGEGEIGQENAVGQTRTPKAGAEARYVAKAAWRYRSQNGGRVIFWSSLK